MTHGSLFSGIGGFDLTAEWMGWENVFQVEWDSFCQKVLTKNFPNVKRYGDIKEFDGTKYRGFIDILTGGFPCQPFSVAGKQKGKGDDRHLWPEMLRVIREIQPTWIVGENVPGIIRMELENICVALENEGYEVQPFIIPSASIGAWDRRDRVWIIAYNNRFTINLPVQQRRQNKAGNINTDGKIEVNPDTKSTISKQSRKTRSGGNRCADDISDTDCKSMEGHSWDEFTKGQKETFRRNGQTNWLRDWIEVASELCRSNARVSHRMDRIKALGNSVNPYVPYQIFKAIEEFSLKT
jgi:DNA (cytosine-5)-methyltransferase 1